MNAPTAAGPPRMSRGLKTALALAIYPTFIWAAAVFILSFSGFFKNDAHETLRQVIFWISSPVVIAHWVAGLYGFVWVLRRLRGERRILWALGFCVGGSIAALIWWWRLIRPLPEPT